MSTTRLELYNDALTSLGERTLASLTENREPRRLLDVVWDAGAVDYCLELGQWNFAMRSVKLEYSPSVEPPWGYNRAFDKPTDYIRTCGVCSDEFFRTPLLGYVDEANYWFASLDVIYVRYVSNDDEYGLDMNKWPKTFDKVVSSHLAAEIAWKLTQSEKRVAAANALLDKRLTRARSNDAMNQPTEIPAPGRWVTSRGRSGGSGDRGNNGSLIG